MYPQRKKAVEAKMAGIRRTVRYKRDKWTNRMAIIGITLVVVCLAIAISAKGGELRKSDREYQIKEELLQAELDKEKRPQQAVLNIKKRMGANAILKGMNLEKGATGKVRNEQIGGHRK